MAKECVRCSCDDLKSLLDSMKDRQCCLLISLRHDLSVGVVFHESTRRCLLVNRARRSLNQVWSRRDAPPVLFYRSKIAVMCVCWSLFA